MKKSLHLSFLAFSLLYITLLAFQPIPFSWLIKATPIILLFWGVVNAPLFSGKILIILALCFSAAGDILLEQGFFIYGIGAFLIAQLNYATYFVRSWQSIKRRWPLTVMLIAYVMLMAFILTPNLGDLQIPVFAYLIVIAFMGLLAVQSQLPFIWAVAGVLIFITSDSLIAIDRFLHPIPMSSYFIMITYYVAQWMIVTGCLKKAQST